MSQGGLARLAEEAGLAAQWADAAGHPHSVDDDVLKTVLAALSLPAGTSRQIADSRARLAQDNNKPPPLQVVRPGDEFRAGRGRRLQLTAEDGSTEDFPILEGTAIAPSRPGYYRVSDTPRRIAVSPFRAHLPEGKLWGVAAQLYALRGGTSAGLGDFAALGAFARQAGEAGADAVAISPAHALFGAAPAHISPYSPSTRLFLNPLYAALDGAPPRDDGAGLIDWPAAAAAKMAALHRAYERFAESGQGRDDFENFVRRHGTRLLDHARFECLDGKFRAQGLAGWRQWPEAYRGPDCAAVKKLAAGDPEVRFQLFLQWQADRALAGAQAEARAAGMKVGLISDLAVGMDPAGSHAWSAPDELLDGLSVGAPPDIYNAQGQNWGLTNFSPQGLRQNGYRGFISTVRTAMRHAGGIRIDHAMGLLRLWLIPQGASPGDGVYLHYPIQDLIGLLTLESMRAKAMVIAEDLGTVPPGFRDTIGRAGLLGMRVLWFERDEAGAFLPPQEWDAGGAALSTTHDLPTLAGWWSGRDIAWREQIDGDDMAEARDERGEDRSKLWSALEQAGCAQGPMPPPDAPDSFVDAAFCSLAETPCPLVLAPVEDFIGEAEQPNIPGTTDQHPNWRRRLATAAPFDQPQARRRAKILQQSRP